MVTNTSINSTCINHAIIVGTGAGYSSATVGTNGQLLTGSTGADPVFATPTSTGGTFTGGAGSVLYTPANYTVGYSNLGVTYASGTGTFTIRSSLGTSLSATNPAYVTLPSKATPGQFVTIALTANQDFIDDAGASQIIGNLFGFTTSVAITVDVPFFIYAVLNDAENAVQFMLGRTPHKEVSPAAAGIGFPGTPGANSQNSLFSFDTITTSQWDANPCVCVGSIRMRMSASDDWTVQTLANTDGIGRFNNQNFFTTPGGQFGANASTYTVANGGTAAVFSASTNVYWISPQGLCSVIVSLTGDGGTDGATAVDAIFTVPMQHDSSQYAAGTLAAAGAAFTTPVYFFSAANQMKAFQNGAAANVLWSAFTNGNRAINFGFTYRTYA